MLFHNVTIFEFEQQKVVVAYYGSMQQITANATILCVNYFHVHIRIKTTGAV